MNNKFHAAKAADAMAQLYVFAAVGGALENGTVHNSLTGVEQRQIIKLSEKAQRKMLKLHDKHMAKITE